MNRAMFNVAGTLRVPSAERFKDIRASRRGSQSGRHRESACYCAAIAAVALFCGSAFAADSIVVLPREFTLSDPRLGQRLLVEEARGEELTGQVTEGVTFASSNPAVVTVEHGVARAAGNGTATITATVGGRTATA